MAQYNASLFFQNVQCEYFPCHEGVAREEFNCMLCYCPLYALGERCGGAFSYTETGAKNCEACAVPHRGQAGVEYVQSRFSELSELASRNADV